MIRESLTRRTVVSPLSAGTAPPAVALATGPDSHPDAELIRLDRELLHLYAVIHATDTEDDQRHEQLWQETVAIHDLIVAAPARTPTGVAIKMRLLWQLLVEDAETLANGPGEQSCYTHHLLWNFIAEAERMGGVELLPLTTGRA